MDGDLAWAMVLGDAISIQEADMEIPEVWPQVPDCALPLRQKFPGRGGP